MQSLHDVASGRGSSVAVPNAPVSQSRPVQKTLDPFKATIRLFADEVVIHRTEGLGSTYDTERVPLLELSFAYTIEGARHVVLASDDEEDLDGARDRAAEARVRRFLESFGAVPLDCLEDWAPSVHADYAVRCEGSIHDFCAFGAYVVPQLRQLGWNVVVAPDYPFRVVEGEPTWYADVEADDERPDWFGLELGVDLEIGNTRRRINLLPALIELLERSNGKGLGDILTTTKKCLALPVGDDLYLPVPADRARSMLRVLAELWDGKAGAKTKVEFPQVRAAALLTLEEAFAKDGTGLVMEGDDRARKFAELLVGHEELEVASPEGLQASLRPYQMDGLKWLQNLRARKVGGVLADDMGLGKTLQTIAHLLTEKIEGRLTKPALIIAPTSLVPNWQREIAKFAPQLEVIAIHGTERHLVWEQFSQPENRPDVVVTSYPILCRDEDKFTDHDFYLVILDEAQTIKNMRSRAHVSARAVEAEHRLCLSGTPVENHLGELWSLLDFVNPGLLGDELHFGRFYRVPIEKQRNDERLAALREVVAPYILRRNKRDVAKELPPKTEVMRPIDLRGGQRELYESIRIAAHAEVRKLIRKKGLAASTVPILGALTKLRQVCCDPRLVRMGSANTVRESAKYQMFMDLCDKQLEGGHRMLVFSQFTSMLALLARGLEERKVPYAILTGDTVDRAAAVDRFEGGAASVFLISLRAGGTGLTLTSADVVVHYDPWWNPAIQAQATDRAYRIGQTKPVISYHLFAAGSVEERILGLQRSKRHMADAILGEGGQTAPLTEEQLDVLFAPLSA